MYVTGKVATATVAPTTTPKFNTPEKVAAAISAAGGKASPAYSTNAGPNSPVHSSASQPTTPVASAAPAAVAQVQPNNSPMISYDQQGRALRSTSGWSNVLDTFLAPWQGKPTYVKGTNDNAALGYAVSGVTGLAEIGSVAYGAAVATTAAGGGAGGSAGAAVGGSIGAAGSLRGYAAALAAGAIGGALLTGGTRQNAAPQDQKLDQGGSSDPAQNPQQNPAVNPYQTGGSPFISNSPGASLRYKQTQDTYTTFNLSQIPTQSAPFNQSAGQSESQAQSSASSLLIPALIVGAALLISKR